MSNKILKIKNISVSNDLPIVLIAGPCQLESLNHSRKIVEALCGISQKLDVKLIFKGSFDKANRTSLKSQRGVGIEEGLTILDKIKSEFKCPVLTDVHEPEQCIRTSEVVDVIQIPAFLCRQTDLLIAAGNTGKVLNVKNAEIKKTNGLLNNKTFMFTGKLVNMSRSEAKSIIEQNSGSIVSNVTKKLDYLIVGEKPTSRKVDAARNFKVKILDQFSWLKMLK